MNQQQRNAAAAMLWVKVAGVYHLCDQYRPRVSRFVPEAGEVLLGCDPPTAEVLMVANEAIVACSVNEHRIHRRRICRWCRAMVSNIGRGG